MLIAAPAGGPYTARMPQRSITVRVPATTANLGPGFDTLGAALDWTILFHFTTLDEPAPPPPGPIERMAASAALTLYRHAARDSPTGLTVSTEGDVPVGRGLGVSASARIAGLLAADALMDGGHDPESLLPLALQLERHGDNAVPAMFGGIQIVVADEDHVEHVRLEPPDDLRLVLFIPEFSMPTEESRRKLPERLTRNQAVHNISRTAMLIAALTQHRYELLGTATEDVIHQPARATLFEPMYPIFQAARDAGALGVYLSGGGPTIAAFATERFDEIAGAMRERAAVHGVGGQTRLCTLSPTGAEVLDEA